MVVYFLHRVFSKREKNLESRAKDPKFGSSLITLSISMYVNFVRGVFFIDEHKFYIYTDHHHKILVLLGFSFWLIYLIKKKYRFGGGSSYYGA